MSFTLIDNGNYKTCVDNVEGLMPAMHAAIEPVREWLKSRCYWTDVDVTETEYKSRDGFIPYRDNCGGVQLLEIIPECEQYDFQFLEFGEHDADCCDPQSGDCSVSNEGHLDAKFRVWLKFEGVNDDGELEFYLYAGGGNGDAPYFRTKYEATIFEESFTARSIPEFKRRASGAVNRLLKAVSK